MKIVPDHIPPLPSPKDSRAVSKFAASFNGYVYFGSIEACAKEAKLRRRQTIVDIRNELFFEERASYHASDSEYLDIYKELLPMFQKFVQIQKDID